MKTCWMTPKMWGNAVYGSDEEIAAAIEKANAEMRDKVEESTCTKPEEPWAGMIAWTPPTPPDDSEAFFGLDRTQPVMRHEYTLTRWTLARWWLAHRIERLARLIGGELWYP